MVRVSPLAEEGLACAATPDVMPLVEAEVLARAVAAWSAQAPSSARAAALALEVVEGVDRERVGGASARAVVG